MNHLTNAMLSNMNVVFMTRSRISNAINAHFRHLKKEVSKDTERQGVHEKVKKFKCEKCTYETYHLVSLEKHIKCVHDKIKYQVCDKCGYASSEKGALRKHERAIHQQIREVCDRCESSFSTKSDLNYHVKTVHE